MSIMEKCMTYAKDHGGVLPSFEKMDEFVSEQLKEYLNALADAVIPEYHDRAIMTAACRLLYEARYNMLEPEGKALCDRLMKRSRIISTESVVRK